MKTIHVIKAVRPTHWLDRQWFSVDFTDAVPPGLFLPMEFSHLRCGDIITYDDADKPSVRDVRVTGNVKR